MTKDTNNNDKPNLPTYIKYPTVTVEWFNSWRDSPRTDGWDSAQWQYMFDTALVHALVYGAQEKGLFGELRKRLEYMGLTFEPVRSKAEIKITPFDEIKRAYERGHSRKSGT